MKTRLAILFVVLLVTSSMPFPTAVAQDGEGTFDDVVEDPVRESVDTATWTSGDATEGSIVRIYQEDWEDVDSLQEAGWHEEVVSPSVGPQLRHVHAQEDKPSNTFVSPISTSSGQHAVTTMNERATYAGGLDSRLVSPPIDLRYVRGASQATTTLHDDAQVAAFLQDLEEAYFTGSQAALGFQSTIVPYHYLFTTPPSEWTPVPCPQQDTATLPDPCEQADPIFDAPAHEGDTSVDLFFLGQFLEFWMDQVPSSIPSSRPDDYGVDVSGEGDGAIYAPNPVNDREGASYVNLTFYHAFDLDYSSRSNDSVFLEVRERQDDGSWSDWRYLQPDEVMNNPALDPSAAAHEATTDDRTMTYNGHAGAEDTKPAFVRSSDGVVASTFNLNRFAGSEVQVAFHVQSIEANPTSPGWFLDDVTVWASTYPRDAAVQRVHAPQEMDRLAVGETFHPNTTIRNFGYRPMENISVSFRVTPANDTSVTLQQDSRFIRHLDPQEALTLHTSEAFHLDEVGDYDLIVNLTTYGASDDPLDDNLTAMPETNPADQNDEVVVPFQVQDVPRAKVDVKVDGDSIQTNVGEPKRFQVSVENQGNVPLGGQLRVTLQRLDRETRSPVGEPRVLAVDTVRAQELPYGRDLTVLGSDENTWTKSYEWSQGVNVPGVYRIGATFVTEDGTFDGNRSAFVRATPLPYLDEDLDTPRPLPFHRSSVFDHGFLSTAYTSEESSDGSVSTQRVNPDPVSRSHVLAATGHDGGVGVATWGNATLNGTGLEGTVTDSVITYDELAVAAGLQGNTADHYWLVRDVDLTEASSAEELTLSFWHTAGFQWDGRATDDQVSPERSRGLVEVLPERNVPLTDPSEDMRTVTVNTTAPDTGFEAADDRTPEDQGNATEAFPVFGRTVATYEDGFSWKQSTVDLTPWKGQKVTLRFHLETTVSRASGSFDQENAGYGDLDDWLVDNVELTARWSDSRERTILDDDVEGDSWRGWSMNRGLTFGDEERPLAFLEGRGWTRLAYEEPFPTGWHVVNEPRPRAGVQVTSPMLYWGQGDPGTTGQHPEDLTLGVLRTPAFTLSDARDPALRILHNYTFTYDDSDEPGHASNGGSVWIVGETADGDEVVRELLKPDEGYDGTLFARYSDSKKFCPDHPNSTTDGSTLSNELHCDTVVHDYPDEPNVFVNRSGVDATDRGESRWTRSVFDLSDYAREERRNLRYHVEFHAVHQGEPSEREWGWLVEDVQITESTFANDMAVEDLVQPAGPLTVGPGLQVPVAVELQNRGLYDQVGAEVAYRILDNEGRVVGEPVVEHIDPGRVVPGTLNEDNPDRNITHLFTRTWKTPAQEGTYTLEVAVNLSGALPGNAYPDDNPSNDILRTRVEVVSARSVGLVASDGFSDRSSISPFLGSTQEIRTLKTKVQNLGTLPEVFTEAQGNAGEFHVNVTVEDSTGDIVFESTAPIRKLAPGEEKVVSFRNAWRPSTSGEYHVRFTLVHPNETVPGSSTDDTRGITYRVFERFVPQEGETLESILQPEAGGWSFTEDGWRFGTGSSYPPLSDAVLNLREPMNLLALRNAILTVNHTYGFEAGYDGGLLEVSVDGGESWQPVPPVRNESASGDARVGYPDEASVGSPLRAKLHESNGMLSGVSGDGDEPEPVVDIFDLGAVPELVSKEVTIFDDQLVNATDAVNRSEDARRGVWTHAPVTDADNGDLGYSLVRPHSGTKMWHSNRSIAPHDSCWRVTSENSSGSYGGSTASCDAPDETFQTARYLNLTLNGEQGLPDVGAVLARESTAALRVSFWDYRIIGSLDPSLRVPPEVPNEVEAYLVCLSCEGQPRTTLDRLAGSGYDNSYRGWTENVYTVDKAELLGWEGEDVRLSLVHHVAMEDKGTLWATDTLSPHMGWFVDDVAVSAIQGSGAVDTLWSSDLEDLDRRFIRDNVSAECDPDHDGTEQCPYYAEKQETGPWTGSWYSTSVEQEFRTGDDHLLWDVRSQYGEEIWGLNTSSTVTCTDDDTVPACSDEKNDHMWVALGPDEDHPERAGGSRLVTPLDLRSAVGNVNLSFWHRYNFHDLGAGGGTSGGVVEVSVDDGKTWIPILPEDGHDGKIFNRSEDPATSTHTTLAGRQGDPEGDSIYGINAPAYTGEQTSRWGKSTLDLSRFAGREVLLSFHASFNTHFRDNQFTPWFWAVDDVQVTGDVLDGQFAELRLRAGSDASETREGWTVHDLQLTGIKHNVNSAVRILGVNGEDPVPAGEPVPFQVRVENRGEKHVAGGEAAFKVEVRVEDDEGLVRRWGPKTVRLAPESTETLKAIGGQTLAFEPTSDKNYTIHAQVELVDEDLAKGETILRDNERTVRISEDLVKPGSLLVLDRVEVFPNHLEAGSEPVDVDVRILNDGFKTRDLQYLNLSVVPKGESEPVLHLTFDDLVEAADTRFSEDFQTRSYAWEITEEQLREIDDGLYTVRVTAEQLQDGEPEPVTKRLYLGTDYISEYAIAEPVSNSTELGEEGGWSSSGPANPQGGEEYRYGWSISNQNRSNYKSFAVTGVTDGVSNDNPRDGETWLVSPELPVSDVGREDVALTFYTQYELSRDDANLSVLYEYALEGEGGCDGDIAGGRDTHNGLYRVGYVQHHEDDVSTSDGLNRQRWEHVSMEIPDAPEGAQFLCVVFYGQTTQQTNGEIDVWRVDDIVLAPYNLELGPDVEAPVKDDMLKTYRFRIENRGAFNDTYRFEFVDGSGAPVDIPQSWDMHVRTHGGDEVDRVALAAGEERELLLEVHVPVQQASGTTGIADLALTAVSETNPIVRKTMEVDLSFEYPPRPNLVVLDLRANDVDLPAGEPRSVVATVANMGDAPARNVPVDIVDTMPASFGVAPVNLTRLDGEPLRNISLMPGEVVSVLAQWTPSRSGPHNVTAILDPQDVIVESNEDDNRETVTAVLDAARFPDLRVSVDVSNTEPQVGDEVHLNATITNRGNARATGVQVSFRVGVADLLDGTPPHILGQPIAPGETVQLEATWPAPFPGTYRVFARAFPLSGALERVETEEDNLDIRTMQVRTRGLTFDGPDDKVPVDVGSVTTTELDLSNRGDVRDSVDLSVDAPHGIRAHVERNGLTIARLDLDNGTTANLTLHVRAPARIATGTYPVTVTAQSLNTTQTETIVVPVHVRRTHGLDVEGRVLDLDTGERTVPIALENKGNGPATVTLDSSNLPASWRLSAEPVELKPYEARSVNVTLDVPTRTQAGVVDLTLEATSPGAHTSAPVRVNVLERPVVDIAVDPGEVHLRPGTSTDLDVTLSNQGNAPAFAALDALVPEGWSADLPRPRARLEPGENLSFTWPVEVPADAGAGTHDAVLQAVSGDQVFRGSATVHVGVPDLTVAHIQQSPRVNIEAGETVTFNVTIRNVGTLVSDEVPVGMYVDDELVDYRTLDAVAANAGTTTEFTWPAEAGEHVLLMVVDPGEGIVEEDEGNNAHLLVVGAGSDVSVFTGAQRAVPLPVGWAFIALAAAALCLRRRWTS